MLFYSLDTYPSLVEVEEGIDADAFLTNSVVLLHRFRQVGPRQGGYLSLSRRAWLIRLGLSPIAEKLSLKSRTRRCRGLR